MVDNIHSVQGHSDNQTPDARIAVGFVGYDYWCKVAADYLAGSRYEPVMLNPLIAAARGRAGRREMLRAAPVRHVRIVHALNAVANLRWLTWFRLHGRRVVLHWIGASDYQRLASMSAIRRAAVRANIALLGATHLIDSPELAEDLARFGFHGEVIRLLPPSVNSSPTPLPAKPAALTYWSDARADFYGRPIVYQMARRFSDVPFRVAGAAERDPEAPPNVEFIGFVADLDPWYRKSSVLIRLPEYDSVSAMVLEAMARGRDVIYSKPFPHARQAVDEAGAVAAMQQHVDAYALNQAGADHVASLYDPREQADRLVQHYAELT